MIVNAAVLKEAILALLTKRNPGATICPSEAARAVCQTDEDWRTLMPDVRNAAYDLASRAQLQITQRGEIVEPGSARGAIRLRLPPAD